MTDNNSLVTIFVKIHNIELHFIFEVVILIVKVRIKKVFEFTLKENPLFAKTITFPSIFEHLS